MTRSNRSTASPAQPHQRRQLHIRSIPVASLRPDPSNARSHPERHVQQLAKSITTFGFNVPLLVDAQGRVIAGHGRLLAARLLGMDDVPAITLEHLTPEQVRAFAIADNRLTDCSTWDDRLLAQQLKLLSDAELDFDLEAIGFELPEIDLRIQALGEVEEDLSDGKANDELLGPPVTVPGDVWQLGSHRIVCGDALDPRSYDTLLRGERAALVFTDPPYNVAIVGHAGGNGSIVHREFAMASGEMSCGAFTGFLRQALAAMKGASLPGSVLFVFIDWRHIREITSAADQEDLELKNVAVWDKGTGGMGSFYRSQHELVFVLKAGNAPHTNNVQLGRFGRNRTNVWQYPGVNSFARDTSEGNLLALHPTVKPLALVADALLDASQRGDRVLDPFLGSGTTLIAAEQTGRVGFGIELDPLYVDVAVRRWQRLTGRLARHAATGQTFDACAAERAVRAQKLPSASDEAAVGEGRLP